jgi:hypothetical protein
LIRTHFGECVALAVFLLLPSKFHAQVTASADSFIDSVGVNVHLASQESAYGDLPRIRDAIRKLGVKHIRDGLLNTNVEDYYTGLTLLARDGVRSLLYADVSQSASMLRAFPSRAPGSLEGVEAPSELDATSALWLKELRETQARITQATSGTDFFTVGPALTRRASFGEFGMEPCECGFGNLHNYFGGQNPGTQGRDASGRGAYPWTLQLAQEAFGKLPLMTTESGYIADVTMANGLPEEIVGRYTVRLLLEQFLHKIHRTYLYELIDMEVPDRGIRDHDGLLRADFKPRPAFTAVSALLQVLQTPGDPTEHREVQSKRDLVAARWKMEGGDSSLHQLALRKDNGDTALVLWREVPGYDVVTKTRLRVVPADVNLEVDQKTQVTALHFSGDGSLEHVTLAPGTSKRIEVNDAPTILLLPATLRVRTPFARRSGLPSRTR